MAGRNQSTPEPAVRWVRFAAWLVAGTLLMAATLFAWHSAEQFVIKDDRFRIADADDFGGQSPDLILEGIHYASASQIRHLFSEDFGRSLFLVPIQERRRQLLEIDWVESAAVSKVWPKTLIVRIHERVPVAFIHLRSNSRNGPSRFALVDKEGYILRPRVASKFTLPVVSGLRENESREDRRARVRRVLGMLQDVGPLADRISEVDVSDPNNLIVSERTGDGVVYLMLGDENYSDRLQNFLANANEIKQKRPDVRTLDLRVDGVITAVGEN